MYHKHIAVSTSITKELLAEQLARLTGPRTFLGGCGLHVGSIGPVGHEDVIETAERGAVEDIVPCGARSSVELKVIEGISDLRSYHSHRPLHVTDIRLVRAPVPICPG